MYKYFTELVDFVGSRPKPFKNKKKYISTGALKANNISEDDVEMVDYETRPSRANLEVENGDILFAKMAFTDKRLLVGEIEANYIYSSGFFAVKPKAGILTSKCLFYLLNSETFRNQKDINSTGATQKAITIEGLKKISLRIPEYHRQNQIGKTLENIDKIIKLKKQQLTEYDQLIKSRFVEMFDGKGLPVLKWNDVFNTTTGKLDSNAMVDGGQYPFFTCAKEIYAIDKYAFDKEALLLAGNNAAGKYDVKYYKGKFNAYQRTYVLDLKQNWSYQLFKYQLEDKLEFLREQSKGSNTRYITLKILADLDFIIPPLEKQVEFEKFCNHVDKLKFVVQKSLDETQKLFDSLMQEYFG